MIKAEGQLLTASAEDRILTYRLLPFGEEGRTSAGRVTVSAGAVEVPEDATTLPLNLEHDYTRPVGRFVSVEETEDGLQASVRIARTRDGDDALALAAEGLRTGISVEIDAPVIKGGRLMAGRLTGAGLVVKPAFDNAQLVAADCGDERNSNMEHETVVTAAEAAPIQSAPLMASEASVDLGKLTFETLSQGGNLEAALNVQLPSHDAAKVRLKDQEVGELWEAMKSERPIVNKIGVKPLTGLVVTGHRRTRGFKLSDWAGSPAELPTGEVISTTREYWNAEAKAGAIRISLEDIEFGGESVVSDLMEDAHRDYVTTSEAEVVTVIKAQATTVTATGGAISQINTAIQTLGSIGARAEVIAVSPAIFGSLANLTANEVPWWFSGGSVSLHGQTLKAGDVLFTSSNELDADEILVFDSRAVDYRESKEFSYRATAVSFAATDVAAVKFNALKITDPGAIILVTGVTGA